MSDFHQSGPVTALPRLVGRPIDELESRILGLARRFPVALVIPMLPQEMDRPALAGILSELCQVAYLDSLVISLNKAGPDDYQRAVDVLEKSRGQIGYERLDGANDVAKVSVIGIGMRSHAGVAARAFKALAERGINIRAITTSEIKFSLLIDEAYTELAVRTLHSLYGLDK